MMHRKLAQRLHQQRSSDFHRSSPTPNLHFSHVPVLILLQPREVLRERVFGPRWILAGLFLNNQQPRAQVFIFNRHGMGCLRAQLVCRYGDFSNLGWRDGKDMSVLCLGNGIAVGTCPPNVEEPVTDWFIHSCR